LLWATKIKNSLKANHNILHLIFQSFDIVGH